MNFDTKLLDDELPLWGVFVKGELIDQTTEINEIEMIIDDYCSRNDICPAEVVIGGDYVEY